MLLAGLEGHAEGTTSFGIAREADDSARHLPDVFLSAREDPEERSPEIHGGAQGLALADHDVRTEIARRSCDRLGDRVHADDEDRLRRRSDVGELFLESAEEIRVLDVDSAYVGREGLPQLREVEHAGLAVVVNRADLDPGPEDVVREDRATVVAQGARDEEDLAALETVGHPGRFAEGRRSVVHGRVRGVHPHEFADEALVLPKRLQEPLADLRLVRRVRRVELGPRGDRANARGDEVVVHPAAQEGRHVNDRAVRGQHGRHAVDDDVLGQAIGEVEFRNSHRGGDVREELVDAPEAHRPEHLVDVRGHPVSAERPMALKDLAWGHRGTEVNREPARPSGLDSFENPGGAGDRIRFQGLLRPRSRSNLCRLPWVARLSRRR